MTLIVRGYGFRESRAWLQTPTATHMPLAAAVARSIKEQQETT